MWVKVLPFSVKKGPEKKVPSQKRCSFFEEKKKFKIPCFKVCRSLMYFILSEIRRRSTFSLQQCCMDDHCLGPFTQLSVSSLKDNEWSPPQWKPAYTPSWISPPNASSESSPSKREELLNPSPPRMEILFFAFLGR